ncbi:MAG: pseudouridine synthase [Planctomycetota bacterium]
MTAARLHKVLAHAGFGSRRRCEERILAGEVTVEGRVVTELGLKADPAKQDVRCAGKRVRPEPPMVVLLNKPRGYVCTTRDEKKRKTVLDLVRSRGRRLYPAGRLDAESQGMVILRGIWLSEGRTAPVKVRVVRRDRQRTVLEVTLREGRKREVRRLFGRFGLKVRRLKRIRIGGLTLGSLKEGDYRVLRLDEIAKLFSRRRRKKTS